MNFPPLQSNVSVLAKFPICVRLVRDDQFGPRTTWRLSGPKNATKLALVATGSHSGDHFFIS